MKRFFDKFGVVSVFLSKIIMKDITYFEIGDVIIIPHRRLRRETCWWRARGSRSSRE